jgi:hypothetical protein
LCHKINGNQSIKNLKPLSKMKKLLYILALIVAVSVTMTSCTEENVAPKTEAENNGGGGSVDPFKP